MSLSLQGTGVSNGVAIGPVHILNRDSLEIIEYALSDEKIETEITRFERALLIVKEQLSFVREKIPSQTQSDIATFIDTHLLMLDDSTLSKVPISLIKANNCNAEWALQIQRNALVKVFDEMDDPYLRTRRDDIDHVVTSIQRELLASPMYHHVNHIQEQRLSGHIIVADDLSPADTVLMQHQGIAAFITESGGPTSHTAILARSLNIPAIVGLHHARQMLMDFETIVVDGQHGVVLAKSESPILHHYQKKKRDNLQLIERHKQTRDVPAVTQDGKKISLHANIELLEDVAVMKSLGATGVGLFRTEYLFMNRETPPTEQEQYETYRQILNELNGQTLTIRTLDLGSDKQIDGGRHNYNSVINPALGLRAIRLCLQNPDIFIPQLRAILRASEHGRIRIMLPMISNVQEIIQTRRQIGSITEKMARDKLAFDANIQIGGMIEVPAAAINAGMLCEFLDFLSIGTNDLIQYALAVDRVDDEVNYLYDPFNPAVLRLISSVIKAGQHAKIPVAMCGEMAGDALFTRLLLGMGLEEFSMHPNALAEVKQVIINSNIKALQPHVDTLLNCTSYDQFQELLDLFPKG